jgi:hypothetical protein
MDAEGRKRLRFSAFRAMIAAGICGFMAIQLWPGRHLIGGRLFYTVFALICAMGVTCFLFGMKTIQILKETPEE